MDRKKPKIARRGITGPFIRYHSTAMPIIEEIPDNYVEKKPAVEDSKNNLFGETKMSILEEAIKVILN